MKTPVLGSVVALSFLALMSGCSPALSEAKAPMTPDVDTAVGTTSLTSADPLPANTAPLEAWGDAKPAAPAAPTAAAPVVQTWDAPAPVAAPVQPAVLPLEPWSYP